MTAAFNNDLITRLQSNIRMLYYRRKQVGKLMLTNEEFIQTFVPYEARELFRDITPLLAIDKMGHKWELRRPGQVHPDGVLNATLYLDSEMPVPVPRDLRIQRDAPEEVLNRIYHWADHGGDTSRDFGRVGKVLTKLNENFSRVAIRYYWPTILAICSESDQTRHLVQELQDMRQPVKLKPLPHGLPLACRQAAETISTARLIPTDVKEEGSPAGHVTIGITECQYYTEAFGEFYGA